MAGNSKLYGPLARRTSSQSYFTALCFQEHKVKGVCMWFYFDDFLFIFPGRYVERIKTDQFLLSRPNQLMGCLINKVASSSMMRMYLTLQGLDNKKIESPHGYRLKFVPEVSQ